MSASLQIYWANAMFSMADRAFNAQCTEVLRRARYRVFLPQEATINKPADEVSPAAESIFRIDTTAILDSDLLVACIDQETIDCGVACEIGIAYAYGIPIIGLYTDIRQHRKGRGQMYKNLYVVGAIEAFGEIVSSVDDLPRTIEKYLPETRTIPRKVDDIALQHFDSIATRYSGFVERLESWYMPSWCAFR